MTICWKAVGQCFTVVLFDFQFSILILENFSIFDLALSGAVSEKVKVAFEILGEAFIVKSRTLSYLEE